MLTGAQQSLNEQLSVLCAGGMPEVSDEQQAFIKNKVCENKNLFTDLKVLEHQARILQLNIFLEQPDVNVNYKDENGYTPLHNACLYGSIDYVQLLLKNNADVLSKSDFGETPLHMAACSGSGESIDIANRLLEANPALLNSVDNYDKTPLHVAILNPATVQFFLDKGIDANSLDGSNTTPLIEAIFCEAPIETLKILIKGGADMKMKNNRDFTALSLARARNYNQHIEFLLTAESELSPLNTPPTTSSRRRLSPR